MLSAANQRITLETIRKTKQREVEIGMYSAVKIEKFSAHCVCSSHHVVLFFIIFCFKY